MLEFEHQLLSRPDTWKCNKTALIIEALDVMTRTRIQIWFGIGFKIRVKAICRHLCLQTLHIWQCASAAGQRPRKGGGGRKGACLWRRMCTHFCVCVHWMAHGTDVHTSFVLLQQSKSNFQRALCEIKYISEGAAQWGRGTRGENLPKSMKCLPKKYKMGTKLPGSRDIEAEVEDSPRQRTFSCIVK